MFPAWASHCFAPSLTTDNMSASRSLLLLFALIRLTIYSHKNLFDNHINQIKQFFLEGCKSFITEVIVIHVCVRALWFFNNYWVNHKTISKLQTQNKKVLWGKYCHSIFGNFWAYCAKKMGKTGSIFLIIHFCHFSTFISF